VPPCDVPQGYASVVPLPAALLKEILSSRLSLRKRVHSTSFSAQKILNVPPLEFLKGSCGLLDQVEILHIGS
jgi:hypothetical protein